MGGRSYNSFKIPGGAGLRYRSLKIPGGAGVRHRKRPRTRRQRGRGAITDLLKSAAKGAGKAILRQGAKNLGSIVNSLGSRTKNKHLKRLLASDLTKAGIRSLQSYANKRLGGVDIE